MSAVDEARGRPDAAVGVWLWLACDQEKKGEARALYEELRDALIAAVRTEKRRTVAANNGEQQ